MMQGESNGKTGKHSFTGHVTAEPKHFLCKEIANERKESLLYISRVQHFLCKGIARREQRQDGKTQFYRT